MKSFKVEMSIQEAKEFLQYIEGGCISNVCAIEMGELSRVFSYTKEQRDYVVHFKDGRDSFDKAKYMHEHYVSKEVPIPRVVNIGNLEQLYYCISERVPGKTLSTFKAEDLDELLDELARHFTKMNETKIHKSRGYGWFSAEGNAYFNTWIECLQAFFSTEEGGFYGDWTRLYEEGFLERDIFEELYSKMLKLAELSPEEPYLVHGDFHLGNILSDGSNITGIVDWEMAMYGDFMLDISTFDFWVPEHQFPQRVRKVFEDEGKEIPCFEERLLCYKLFKGIDGLRFFAKKDDRQGYGYVKDKLLDLLKK